MLFKQPAAVPGVPAEIEVTGVLLAALVKAAAIPQLSDEERFEIAALRFIAARALHRAARPRSDVFALNHALRET